MEKETPVETASAPDPATTQANTEPRSASTSAPDTAGKTASNPAPSAAADAGDEDDSDWGELDGMGEFCSLFRLRALPQMFVWRH